MRPFQLFVMMFVLVFPGINYATDSSSIVPIDIPPFIQTFVLGSGMISHLSIPNGGPVPIYLYLTTDRKKCPNNMVPSMTANIVSIATVGTVESFLIHMPFGLIPTPTWEMNYIPVYGDQGYKSYGPGYYQSLAVEVDIVPLPPDPPYPAYVDLHYTLYCVATS